MFLIIILYLKMTIKTLFQMKLLLLWEIVMVMIKW